MTYPISVKTDITIHPPGPKSETFQSHEIAVDGKSYILEVARKGAFQKFTKEDWEKIGSSAQKVIQGLGGSQVKMADFNVEATTCHYLDTEKKTTHTESASGIYKEGARELSEFFKNLWNQGVSSPTSSPQQSPSLKQEGSPKRAKEEINVMELPLPPSKIEEVKDAEAPESALKKKKDPKEQSPSSVSEQEALEVAKKMDAVIQEIDHEDRLLNQLNPEASPKLPQPVLKEKSSSPTLVKGEPPSVIEKSAPALPSPVKPAEKRKKAARRIKPLVESRKHVIQKFTTGYRPPKSLAERIKLFFRTFFLLS